MLVCPKRRSLFAQTSLWYDHLKATLANNMLANCLCTCHRNPGCSTCDGCAFCDPQLWSSGQIWDPDRGCAVNRCGSSLQCVECAEDPTPATTAPEDPTPATTAPKDPAPAATAPVDPSLAQYRVDTECGRTGGSAACWLLYALMTFARGSVSALTCVGLMLLAFARGSVAIVVAIVAASFKLLAAIMLGMLVGLQHELVLAVAPLTALGLVPTAMATDFALPVGGDAFSLKSAVGTNWIVDCGATKHCTPSRTDLFNVTDANPNAVVRVGNGKTLKVEAIGTVKLEMRTRKVSKRKGKTKVEKGIELMELSNFYVVPEMKCRLISSDWAWRHDNIGTHLNNDCYLRLPSGAQVPFARNSTDSHYRVASACVASDLTADDSELLHASLGHFSSARINLAKHDGYTGLGGYKHDPSTCEACLANKRKKSVPKKSTSGRVFTFFGECVCSDVCGPFPESPQGFVYACNFYDKYSHLAAVYFMKTKSAEEIKRCHDTFLSDYQKYIKGGKIEQWVTDDGQSFHSHALDQMCVELSTRRSFAVPHVKEKHGSAERLWGILLGPAKRSYWHAGNDTGKEGLWPFLLTHACMVHNSLPTASLSPVCSPLEMVTKKKPDLSIFKGKVPLSDCWVNTANPDDKPVNKLSANNIKAVYLCYDQRRCGDFVYIPELRRITTCFHVTHCPREFTLLGESVTVRRHKERGDLPTSAASDAAMAPLNVRLPPARDSMGNVAVPPPTDIADV